MNRKVITKVKAGSKRFGLYVVGHRGNNLGRSATYPDAYPSRRAANLVAQRSPSPAIYVVRPIGGKR